MTGGRASERVEQLLDRLTTAEKVGQLIQYFHFRESGQADAALARGEVGSLLFVTDPNQINSLQRRAIEGNAHGIPVLFGFDVIHGLRTIFPVPIGLAASWDEDLVVRVQTVSAREARAVGIHWTFAPMVDIARDPRWGRMVEGAGEDPLLGSVIAAAHVRGFQGERPADASDRPDGIGDRVPPDRVIAGPKHIAGYGAALGGRDYDEVDLSDQQLYNVYLPPFLAAIQAGARNVMSAYMDLNGVPATGNRYLLTDLLRHRLGFEGWVVSDADAVRDLATHHFAADQVDAAVRAIEAGVDMEMAVSEAAFEHLAAAVESGRVTTERLDASVRRVLAAKEALGLFDQPYVDEDAARTILADPAHREVAREAAAASAVLLRNAGELLPLDAQRLHRVAVIGPMADSARDTLGPWVFDYDLDETVTVLDGLRDRLEVEGRTRVTYAPGIRLDLRRFPSMFAPMGEGSEGSSADFDEEAEFEHALHVAEDADVAIVVLGERQDMIGEGASRSSLELPGEQLNLLEAVVATGTPTVLVLLSGRPLDLRWAAENVPAILQAWYPGTRGGEAVADLLLGEASPAGKLPFTWPRTVGQVPLVYSATRSHDPDKQDRRYWDEESTPLFPFGHGLSYARFTYDDLAVGGATTGIEGTVTVTVEVTNTSGRDGVEVVQLYLHQRYGSSSRPLRQLAGFRRVAVRAGATERVSFTIGPEQRRYWSAATREWTLDASSFDVWVGGDSTASLHGEFEVTDDRP